jgi:pimeloyl-ACP methyl ester carboxylesterase
MPFLNANGIRTRYEIEGEGPALLLIAGNGMDRSCFKDQVPAFAKHFRCITYDMRGIGESDVPPADYVTREMAMDALALLDGLKIERAHIGGYSLGGCIGQEMALAAPERVATLSLYSSLDKMQPYLRRRYEILIKILMEGTPELWAMYTGFTAFGENYINAHDAEIEQEVKTRAARWHGANPPSKEGLLGHYRALMLHDTTGRLSAIRCPTWIAVGTSDTVTPPSYSKRMQAAIAGAEINIFEGGPHRLLNFAVREFNDAALAFLLRHKAA